MPQYKYRDEDQHLIENYELAKADNFKGWVLHHRLEFDLEGNEVHTPATLNKLGMYNRRPYFELIYMTRRDHQILHNKAKKGKFTEERRKNISDSIKKVMSDPVKKAIYDKNRHRFPIGNNKGRVK